MADAPAHLHRHGVFRRDRCSPGFHRRADGAGGRGREAVLLAGHRLAAGRQCPAARHSGRPGLHSCRGAVLSRYQSADRRALRRDRSQDQIRMKLRANLIIGGALFALAILVGLLAPWLAHTDPVLDANLLNAEEAPSWTWWFGTDD